MLHPGLLIAGPDHATLDASLTVSEPTQRRPVASPHRAAGDALSLLGEAIIGAVTLTDDQATAYALRIQSLSGGPVELRLSVDPVPARGRSWLELRGQDGSAARLLPSAHPGARASGLPPVPGSPAGRELLEQALMLIRLRLIGADRDTIQEYCSIALARAATLQRASRPGVAGELPGQLTRLCALLTGHGPAGRLPREWSGMLDAAGLADGALQHLDISAALPPIDDTAVRVDSLISEPDSWHIHLRAEPGWWRYSADGQHKWAVLAVDAQDDLGGRYLTEFGGSARKGDLEELALRFRPRLNSLARALTLTFAGASERAALEFRLP